VLNKEPEMTTETSVQQHYDNLLGAIYSWTLGDFDARVAASELLFRKVLHPQAGKLALDLGCGTGVQSLALARLGYGVLGMDFSETILQEYRLRTAGVQAKAVFSDISAFKLEHPVDVALCFGDTISHLPSWAALRSMLACVSASLAPGGEVLFATRDHTRVYEGDDRFLLIRADANQSMTCFVEDAGDRVRVTDIVHRLDEKPPTMVASSYYKLRVSPENLKKEFADAGIPIRETHTLPGGVHVLYATRA
jgi:SAM-dependent methyltransferase